jgi:hypothetical protein
MNDHQSKSQAHPISSFSYSSAVMAMIMNEIAQMHVDGAVSLGSLLRLIFSRSSMVRRFFDVPTVLPANLPLSIKVSDLGQAIDAVRTRFRHDAVNEMHLLLALLELHSPEVHAAFRPIVDEYRANHPYGSVGQKLMREQIMKRAPETIAQYEIVFTRTPFEPERLAKELNDYLRSEFYPYDSDCWIRFREDCIRNRTNNDDVSAMVPLHAFVAHGTDGPI